MVIGSLRGNVVLGLGLHYTRLLVALVVFPLAPDSTITATVLLAWSITEICRYPFYILSSPLTEKLRCYMPLLTFPVGAGAEALACYNAAGQLQVCA